MAKVKSEHIRGGINKKPNLVGIVIGSILVVLFFGFPYALMFITSLKTRLEVTDIPPVYFPEEPRWQNYIDVWSSSVNPASSLLSTTVIALGATLLVLLVATPAAYYIARFRFPGRMVFLLLVLCTQMLQPTVLAVGLFQEFKGWSGYAVWGALILINGAFNLSFAIWIMQAFFASVPKEVDEAALIDGLGRLQTMFRISLPLVWPGIVTAIVFVFVNSWNEFAAALILVRQNDLQPLTVSMPRFLGLYVQDWQYLFTVALVAIVPVIILFSFIEKRLIGGLTAGSVK
ncbi:carbohydrate ABC transporter permease [Tessaracoccus sp. MC1865]|uniref:carbohydrate ABC transporter permease n=1 Tax=unclassified Tessaracoccus TaxID=2635419 RepID=UPI0009F99B74|nr:MULTISPECIES: carbohydrate ABC transporter permease [unclassified Tessaracoccus]MBB1484771.1 carbohydrate ABC transporter permease [Tessaracoccus sp. MC1865]MBB1510096.1 carbohydrate ABC transporter permease [Tessaracoccus sp. MC1756]MCG6566607.1 sugar ABC transporter permease [Tessaracoccus sp. ZS01]QTO36291.1 carbohydrate ABC transporter permease [Tessaracoccus sp. MC1865]